jgi:hypothetical protein
VPGHVVELGTGEAPVLHTYLLDELAVGDHTLASLDGVDRVLRVGVDVNGVALRSRILVRRPNAL